MSGGGIIINDRIIHDEEVTALINLMDRELQNARAERDQLRAIMHETQSQKIYAYAITGENIDMVAKLVDIETIKNEQPDWEITPLYKLAPTIQEQANAPIYQTQHYDETCWYDTNKSNYDICSHLEYVKTRVVYASN